MRKLAQWATEEGERVGSHPINSGCFQAGQVGGIATDTISRKRRRFRENQKKKRKKNEKKKKQGRAGKDRILFHLKDHQRRQQWERGEEERMRGP